MEFFSFALFLEDRVSLHNTVWFQIHYVAQADLELIITCLFLTGVSTASVCQCTQFMETLQVQFYK